MDEPARKNFWGVNVAKGGPPIARPFEVRLWEKIDVRGPDECWPWLGAVNQFGYGVISMYPVNTTKVVTRVMYERLHGIELRRDQLVCHTCDTPICVNYTHLWVGSNQENQADATTKGRNGNSHGMKVTDAQVVEMRERYVAGAAVAELATDYGIDFKHCHAIVKGTKRCRAGGPIPAMLMKGEDRG